MVNIDLAERAAQLFAQAEPDPTEALALYHETVARLETGSLRVAEPQGADWQVNSWVKQLILLGFRYGNLSKFSTDIAPAYDKHTLPPRQFTLAEQVRLVPGGSAVRCGAYVAKGSVIMPPAYINIGAYVAEGCLIDSHALVGSCAQIGKDVHLSAASQIGGVLEPVGALPVIIEDQVFIGGNCGIYEGTIIQTGAVLGSGVIITRSTAVFDNVRGEFLSRDSRGGVTIPARAVVVPGSRPLTSEGGNRHQIQVYCPVIIKYCDSHTAQQVLLEELLR